MPFDAEFFAASRRYLADEYRHHKRLFFRSKGYPGEEYHRHHMSIARRHFLALAREARHEHSL